MIRLPRIRPDIDLIESSPVATLRRATAQQHELLDHRLDLFDPALTADRYAGVLEGLSAIHATLDVLISRRLHSIDALDVGGRRKLPNLIADLADLGRSPAVPIALDIGDSWAAALGAMYVSEGSTLGGAVIAPRVRAALGDRVPARHFTSYGADVPARWKAFRQIANAMLAAPADTDAACRAACTVFDRFAECLVDA